MEDHGNVVQVQGWLKRILLNALKGITFSAFGISILLAFSYLIASNFFSSTTIIKSFPVQQLKGNKLVIDLNKKQLLNHTIILKLKNVNAAHLKKGVREVPLTTKWEIICDGKLIQGSSKEKILFFHKKGKELTASIFGIYEKYQKCTAKIFLEGNFSDILTKNGSLEIYKYYSLEIYLQNKGQFGKTIINFASYPWFLFYFLGGMYQMIIFVVFGIVVAGLVLIDFTKKRRNR